MDLTEDFAANETKVYNFELRIDDSILGGLGGNIDVTFSAGVLGVANSGTDDRDQINLPIFDVIEGTVDVSEAYEPGGPLIASCCCDPTDNDCWMDFLVIDGNLVIDEDYCFMDLGTTPGIIIMKEDAKITVQAGQKLTLRNVVIHGCDAMWEAIEVEPGGELRIVDCTIRDGIRAIHAWAGSTIDIINTTFLNNRFGLYAESEENEFGAINVARFYNNTFLTDEAGLISPYENQKGQAGIYLSNISAIDISAPYYTEPLRNHFENLYNGIISEASNVVCNYNRFKDIEATAPGTGYAIHISSKPSFGPRLFQQKGLGKGYSVPTIENCTHGIYCTYSRLTATDNYIIETDYGVSVSRSQRVNILENVIESRQTGILMRQNSPSYTTIQNNEIYMDEEGALPDAIGIRIDENPIGFEGIYQVRDNFIALDNARTGIQATSGRFLNLVNNTVFMDENVEYDGIRFLGSWKTRVTCNDIIGPDVISFTETRGILGANASRSNVSCNEVDETELGIHFLGLNEGSLLRGNEFGDHYYGLQLGESDGFGNPIDASIGLQVHYGNLWTENAASGGVQAKHVSIDDFVIEQSTFVVDEAENMDFLPTNNKATDEWFIDLNDMDDSYTCPASNECPNGVGWAPFEPQDDELWKKLARGTFTASQYETEQRWSGAYHLYKSIQDEEYEPTANTTMDTFLIGATSSDWADFYSLEKDAEMVLMPAEKDLEDLAEYDSLLITKFEALLSLSIQADTAATEHAADSLLGLKTAVIAAASGIGFSLDTLGVRVLEDTETSLATLKTDNEAIVPTETPGEVLQIVNRVFFRTLASGVDTFTNAEKDTLYAIASMCPLEGGDAVYFARSLYALVALDTLYEDSVLCTVSPHLRRAPLPALPPAISLHPNPATDWVELTTNLKDTEPVDVTIYNVLGKKMKSLTLIMESRVASLDVSDLLPGTYFLKLETGISNSIAVKFVIIR